MTHKIDGMTCNACKMMIEMAFEDHGYEGCSVDLETAILTVPDDMGCDKATVCDIVQNAGAYNVVKE